MMKKLCLMIPSVMLAFALIQPVNGGSIPENVTISKVRISQGIESSPGSFTTSKNSGISILDNPFRYGSYYSDAESGMSYCSARYYSPELMAWITRDTWDVSNRYGYCSGNPVDNIDPGGHMNTLLTCMLGAGTGAIPGAVIELLSLYSGFSINAKAALWLTGGIIGVMGAESGALGTLIMKYRNLMKSRAEAPDPEARPLLAINAPPVPVPPPPGGTANLQQQFDMAREVIRTKDGTIAELRTTIAGLQGQMERRGQEVETANKRAADADTRERRTADQLSVSERENVDFRVKLAVKDRQIAGLQDGPLSRELAAARVERDIYKQVSGCRTVGEAEEMLRTVANARASQGGRYHPLR